MSMTPRRFTFIFLRWWLVFMLLGALWALATPIGGAPDAPAQVVRAVSVVRGQVVGPSVPGANADVTTQVKVPLTYTDPVRQSYCYAFKPDTPASCSPKALSSNKVVSTTTYVGRYIPIYYFLVGWPSLLSTSVAGLYLLQLASMALGAVFLALAMAAAASWSTSAWLPIGIAVAASPMTLFLSSQVNPNGLETDAAVTMWTCGVLLALRKPSLAPAGLVGLLGLSAATVVLMRSTSLVWPLCLAVSLAVLLQKGGRAAFWRRRDVKAWALVVVAAGVFSGVWTLAVGGGAVLRAPDVFAPRASLASLTGKLLPGFPSWLAQAVGDFGWLDTPSPRLVLGLWTAATTVVVAAGLYTGRGRAAACLATLCSLAFVVPLGLTVAAAHSYHYDIAQGRYFLPLWAGLPVVMAAFATRGTRRSPAAAEQATTASSRTSRSQRPSAPWASALVAVFVIIGQVADFYWALHRYATGVNGPLAWASHRGTWSPPVPAWALLALFAVTSLVYGVWLSGATLATPRSRRGRPPHGRGR